MVKWHKDRKTGKLELTDDEMRLVLKCTLIITAVGLFVIFVFRYFS